MPASRYAGEGWVSANRAPFSAKPSLADAGLCRPAHRSAPRDTWIIATVGAIGCSLRMSGLSAVLTQGLQASTLVGLDIKR